uniref:Uncharacterized protein n=1 Tax=Cacopsylla melanoneura TaxID=428564 RepID=A0A8D8Y5D7_9HEMI
MTGECFKLFGLPPTSKLFGLSSDVFFEIFSDFSLETLSSLFLAFSSVAGLSFFSVDLAFFITFFTSFSSFSIDRDFLASNFFSISFSNDFDFFTTLDTIVPSFFVSILMIFGFGLMVGFASFLGDTDFGEADFGLTESGLLGEGDSESCLEGEGDIESAGHGLMDSFSIELVLDVLSFTLKSSLSLLPEDDRFVNFFFLVLLYSTIITLFSCLSTPPSELSALSHVQMSSLSILITLTPPFVDPKLSWRKLFKLDLESCFSKLFLA